MAEPMTGVAEQDEVIQEEALAVRMAEPMSVVAEQAEVIQEEILAATALPDQSSVIMFKWGSKQKPFRCQLCDMLFENGEDLRDHMTKHTDIQPAKPFPCKICPKSFQTSKSLERHCLIHYGQALKRCKFCYKVFANKENLDKHVAIHDGKKPYKCGQCGDQFVFRQGLETHRVIHTGVRPFVCPLCNKGFNRKDILERHMIVHSGDKKHKCVECGKNFAHSFVLKRHTRRVHSKEFNGEECDICGKFIKSKENIRRHKKLHTGEREFKCSICDKTFTQKQHAIDHMVIHTSLHPYKCSYCDKEFKYKRSLNRHISWHEGREKWPCNAPGCDMTYPSRSNLKRHMLVHKKNRWQCSVCMDAFPSSVALKRHQSMGHDDEDDITMYREIGVGTDDLSDLKDTVKRIMGSSKSIDTTQLICTSDEAERICKTILVKDHTNKAKTPAQKTDKTDKDSTKIPDTATASVEKKDDDTVTEKPKEEIILIVLENDGQRQIMVETSGEDPNLVMQMSDGTTQDVGDLSGDDRSQLIQTLLDFAEQQTGTMAGSSRGDEELVVQQIESSDRGNAETVEQQTDSNASAIGNAELVEHQAGLNVGASKSMETVKKQTDSNVSPSENMETVEKQTDSNVSANETTEMVEEQKDLIATSGNGSETVLKVESETVLKVESETGELFTATKVAVNSSPVSETPNSSDTNEQTSFPDSPRQIIYTTYTSEQNSYANSARRIVEAACYPKKKNPEPAAMETEEEATQAPSVQYVRVDSVHDYAKAPKLQDDSSNSFESPPAKAIMTVVNSEDGSEMKLHIYPEGSTVVENE